MAHMLGLKLGALLVKTLTKPIANSMKKSAAKPGFLRDCCLRYGQLHHNFEARLSLRLLGHSAKSIKLLPEDQAVQIGANVFSEVFVFVTAGYLIYFEISRKARIDDAAKAVKDQKERAEKAQIEARFVRLEDELNTSRARERELVEHVNRMSALLTSVHPRAVHAAALAAALPIPPPVQPIPIASPAPDVAAAPSSNSPAPSIPSSSPSSPSPSSSSFSSPSPSSSIDEGHMRALLNAINR